MPTRTKNVPAMSAPPWPSNAYVTGMSSRWTYCEDLYTAMLTAGCDIPAGLLAQVQALETAARWRISAADDAAYIDGTWNDAAVDAARRGEPMPDIDPLVRRQQLLNVRSEVGQRITDVTSRLGTALVVYLRNTADDLVLGYLRPVFDAIITDAAGYADAIPANVLDDGQALRAGLGGEWIALGNLERRYAALLTARNALAEIVDDWPHTDARRVMMIGSRVTVALLDREPQHPIARFASRVRNRDTYGLHMPTAADVEQLLRGDDR